MAGRYAAVHLGRAAAAARTAGFRRQDACRERRSQTAAEVWMKASEAAMCCLWVHQVGHWPPGSVEGWHRQGMGSKTLETRGYPAPDDAPSDGREYGGDRPVMAPLVVCRSWRQPASPSSCFGGSGPQTLAQTPSSSRSPLHACRHHCCSCA